MRAIDTNVLVRLITRDDARQAASADVFVEAGTWVSLLALMEAMWVLAAVYESTPVEIAKALDMLLDHKSLIIQDSQIVRAAIDRFRLRPSLGFSDCLLFEVARSAGHLPFGTFDRELGKIGGCKRL